MEWWHIVPLVLAVVVFLLAGTAIEQHLEGAVLRVINRQAQSLTTVGVETSTCLQQDLQQQQEEWLQQQKLLQEQQEVQKGHRSELANDLKEPQQEVLQHQQQQLLQEQHQQQQLLQEQQQRWQKQQDLQKLLQKQHNEFLAETYTGGMKSLPNVNRHRPASQATVQSVVASAQRQQDPLPPQVKSLQEQKPVLEQRLHKQPQPQLSDVLPPLPFTAVSEKSILQPTSKTTVVTNSMDMQITKPNI